MIAHRSADALLEIELYILRLVRRLLGGDAQDVHLAGFFRAGVEPWVFQDAALEGNVQKVAVHGVGFFRRGGHGDAVLFRVGDHFGPPWELLAKALLPPRGDHLQLRRQGGGRQFEAHLVIPLAGGAVGDRVGVFRAGNFHHALGDQGPGDAGAQKILALVNGPGLDHRENEVAGEFLPQIVDVAYAGAGAERLFLQTVQFLLLAHVGAKGHNLGRIGFLQPGEQHGSVQTPGISDHDFHVGRTFSGRVRGSESPIARERGRPRIGGSFLNFHTLHIILAQVTLSH